MQQLIKNEFKEHVKAFDLAMQSLIPHIEVAANLCIDCINNDGKILLIGNGGSAADAQHIAAELVGRYKVDRKAISAIALTTDTSIITAISNDYGYTHLFDRQIEALVNKGDVVIGISTSGKSINVINALKLASRLNCKTIGFSGQDGGAMIDICDITLEVPSGDTPRIQEMHILIGHIICHLIDQEFMEKTIF